MASSPSKRVLLTGGAGFIGCWLTRRLLEKHPDWQLTNLDLLAYAGNLENLRDVADLPNYKFVQGDITDAKLVAQLMADTDIVINCAAQTHVDRSISGPTVFVHTNVLGTQILLEAARQNTIEKFVQISTDEVYGSIGDHTNRSESFNETSPIRPSSPYSASKSGADLLALGYHHTYGLPVCITRCSNNYGPNQYPEKLIPLFILNALADKAVPVYGDGLNVRDWIHVADHAEAVCRVVEDGRPGEVYNIGSNNERTNLEITKMILGILNKPESLIEYVTDRPGHDRRYAIDSSKIKKELNWQATRNFENSLKETVLWYQNNTQWVDGVKQRQSAMAV